MTRGGAQWEGGLRGAVATIATLVVLGGLLRLTVAWGLPSTPLGDELYYAGTALHIARGDGHVSGPQRMKARWPPGQSWWLSRFVSADAVSERPELLAELSRTVPQEMDAAQRAFLRGAVVSSVLLGALVVAICSVLAGLLFGRRAAVLAAALACGYPTLIASSTYLWSEALFTALLAGAVACAVAWTQRPHAGLALLSGALFGLAGLTREVGLPIGAAAGLWWIATAASGGRRRAAVHAALLLAAAALVVLPWTLRNQRELGQLVPVSTVGWMGLREGNTLGEGWLERDWDAIREFRLRYVAIPDEIERMEMARREALELIREAQPGWLPRKLALNLGLLLSPDSDLFYKLQHGAYGSIRAGPQRALLVVTVAAWVLVFVAAVLGIATAPDSRRRLLPLFLFAPLLAVHVVANAFPKYRVPLLPVLLAYASFGLLEARGRFARLGGTGRALVGATLAGFALCVAFFAETGARVWRGPEASEAAPAAASSTRPGRIILLSMDTVRADAVGNPALTPHIARIAAEGVRFSAFYAASSYTIPSHMSIFTGLDAVEHGVTVAHARLGAGVPTLAELLREAGYRTRAFHEGGFVEARFGFARGFEIYRRYPRVEVVGKSLPSVLEWMRAQGEAPYFLFLHTYAAHFPYGGFDRYRSEHPERGLPGDETLREWRRRWPGSGPLGPDEAREIPADVRHVCTLYNHLAESHAELLPCGGYLFDAGFEDSPHYAADLAALRRSYEARVARVDAAVGRLRALLEEQRQWEDTLFVITSDHGEAFFEHGMARHDFVPFDEVMKVPLIVSYPRLAAARVVDGLAWHLDLFPTLLGLAGLEAVGPRAGRDLSEVLAGRASIPAERVIFPAVLRPAHRAQEPLRRIAVSQGRKRIQGHPEFGDPEGFLFELESDPAETRNLRALRPAQAAALDARLADWERERGESTAVHQNTGRRLRGEQGERALEISDAEREELRALGYVE